MKIVQLNGRIEIASLRGAESFQSIFDDVARIVADACDDCSTVIDLLSDTQDRVGQLSGVEPELRADLDGVANAVLGVLEMRGGGQPA